MQNDKIIINDGRHIKDVKTAFEWWYFDFDLDSGEHFYIEWHAPVFNTRDDYSMFILRYIWPNKGKKEDDYECLAEMKILRLNNSLVTSENNRCSIKFPGGAIEERDGQYLIKALGNDFSIKLVLYRLCPPCVFKEEEILFNLGDNKGYFAWSIPFARAHVNGEIEIDGKKIEVKGIAYHDHNYGNINIKKSLSGWVWARMHFDDITVVFGDIVFRDSNRKKMLIMLNEQGKKYEFENPVIDYIYGEKGNGYESILPEKIIVHSISGTGFKLVLLKKKVLTVQESPLGNFRSHILNTYYSYIYYLLRLHLLPCCIKKLLGRFLYMQAEVCCEMHEEGLLTKSTNGKIEVLNFEF